MWKDVKKEFDIDSDGKEILKKVTKESTFSFLGKEKEKWEFAFRGAGILVIIFSIIGLWISLENQRRQQRFQIEQQRALLELDIYKKTVKSISQIADGTNAANERDEFIYDIVPTIQILKNDSLTIKVDSFKKLYCRYLYLKGITDSVFQFYNVTKILSSITQNNTDDSVIVRDLTNRYDALCATIAKNYDIWTTEREQIINDLVVSNINQPDYFYTQISNLLLILNTHFNNIILYKKSTYNYRYLSGLHDDYINFVNNRDFYNLRFVLDYFETKNMQKMNNLRTDIINIMQGSNKLLNQSY